MSEEGEVKQDVIPGSDVTMTEKEGSSDVTVTGKDAPPAAVAAIDTAKLTSELIKSLGGGDIEEAAPLPTEVRDNSMKRPNLVNNQSELVIKLT